MLESSARRPRALAVAAVVFGLLLTGCTEEKKVTPKPSPTPIGSLNTLAMQVPRIEFCGLLPDTAVSHALGGKPDSDSAYGNGDLQELQGVGQDVVHEIGCSWAGKDGVAARAWVFASPISREFARRVIASGEKTKGCRTVPGPAYGRPATTQVCSFSDGTHRVRHAGLFGQSWLTCELAAGDVETADLRSRTDAWCVEVANALNTAR
ncbi:MAG: hypothetical protein ABIW17_02700 [Marmoricola sp.]